MSRVPPSTIFREPGHCRPGSKRAVAVAKRAHDRIDALDGNHGNTTNRVAALEGDVTELKKEIDDADAFIKSAIAPASSSDSTVATAPNVATPPSSPVAAPVADSPSQPVADQAAAAPAAPPAVPASPPASDAPSAPAAAPTETVVAPPAPPAPADDGRFHPNLGT
jgi:hypothetical protein